MATAIAATRIGRLFERCCERESQSVHCLFDSRRPDLPKRPCLWCCALERGGADLIELGVPFSDPIADGPVIQRASERALQAGTTSHGFSKWCARFASESEIPLLLFSYLNPVLHYGFERLATRSGRAGVDGVLLTDLSVEEAEEPVPAAARAGLDTVFLGAPTSTERRLELVAKHSSGFVYLVSRTGVTGEQASLSAQAIPLIERMRRHTDLPLAVGFRHQPA